MPILRKSSPAARAVLRVRCSRCRSVSAWLRLHWLRRCSSPDRFRSNAPEIIHGIHRAFWVLGGMTILSTIVFRELKSGDGEAVSSKRWFIRSEAQEIDACFVGSWDWRNGGSKNRSRQKSRDRPLERLAGMNFRMASASVMVKSEEGVAQPGEMRMQRKLLGAGCAAILLAGLSFAQEKSPAEKKALTPEAFLELRNLQDLQFLRTAHAWRSW